MTGKPKNVGLVQTLDDGWSAQTSTRSCECVFRPSCSRAGHPFRHES